MRVDLLALIFGFFMAVLLWWLTAKLRPIWKAWRQNLRQQGEALSGKQAASVEDNHRRLTLRRAQGMHLAASLFALDEVLVPPLLLAAPAAVEPGRQPAAEDVVTQTLPYMPAWPELAASYGAAALTVQQALAGGANLVLIGQPGVGKSVMLAHLASLAANRDASLGALQEAVPFLVHVADLPLPLANAKDLLAPIVQVISEEAPVFDLGGLPAFANGTFRVGQALLLLDGFDELPAEEQKSVSEYLGKILQAFPKVRIVATGAPEYLDGLIGLGLLPLSVLPWSMQKCTAFIRRWGELWSEFVVREAWAQAGPQQVDALLLGAWVDERSGNPTPLELTLRAWGAYAGDSLGPRALDGLATHVRRLTPAGTPTDALEALALHVVLSALPVFDPRTAREWVRAFEPADEAVNTPAGSQPAQPAAEEARRGARVARVVATPTPGLLGRMVSSGLLTSHLSNRLRFTHPVLLGYLAGRALCNFNATDTVLNQPDWMGKYLAVRYLSAQGDASPFVENLVRWTRLPMQRPLLSAGRWLRDAAPEAPWRETVLAALAVVMQTDGTPLALRAQAMAALALSGDASVAVLFRKFLAAFSADLVQLAALGSGAVRDAKAIAGLEDVLQGASLGARRAACLALVMIGTDEALEAVARTLLSADEDGRRAAAESLANDEREGHAMLKDGVTMSDILVRRAAAYGLGRVATDWAADLLRNLQVQDDQWVVRNAASEALESMSADAQRAPRRLTAPAQTPWLIEFAGKAGLGLSPGTPATGVLIQAFRGDDPEVRLAALPYFRYAPTEGMMSQLYGAMYGDDLELREAVFQLLWEIGASGTKLPSPTQYGYA